MSSICPRFTQNAWKKDLCSNCFKSKDEHKIPIQSTVSSSSSSSSPSKTTAAVIEKTTTSFGIKKSNNEKSCLIVQSTNTIPSPKGIIVKQFLNRSKKCQSVSFQKELTKIIGYGGDWSDTEISEDEEHLSVVNCSSSSSSNSNNKEDLTSTDDDEEYQELIRLTRNNTDFNMNNGNLLGSPDTNIKKTFAALRLGTPQIDSNGKKQTLKISVTPFGTAKNALKNVTKSKMKFESNKDDKRKFIKKDEQTTVTVNSNCKEFKKSSTEGDISPPIERAMEKSLLEEISETLEKKQQSKTAITNKGSMQCSVDGKVKFEINCLSSSSPGQLSSPSPSSSLSSSKPSQEIKKSITSRNGNETAAGMKESINSIKSSKISIFPKCSDSESNTSDGENGISAYYDVIETRSVSGYDSIPPTNGHHHDHITKNGKNKNQHDNDYNDDSNNVGNNKVITTNTNTNTNNKIDNNKNNNKFMYTSSQYITDILPSSKTHSVSYSLHKGNFMTSKITSDGLIVTKCNSDDALDSTESSFDGSSDEETSYNMNRSESDSGIGISIGNDSQSMTTTTDKSTKDDKSLNSIVIANSDYEDIQIVSQGSKDVKTERMFAIEKSRELAGEPDGSADPDGNVEIMPALPKSPPPVIVDNRVSFFHGVQKNVNSSKKPELPAKPSVSVIKTFAKRTPTNVEQQVISQLQQVIGETSSECGSQERLTLTRKEGNDCSKLLKKGRAPNPPPSSSPSSDNEISVSNESDTQHSSSEMKQVDTQTLPDDRKSEESKSLLKSEDQHATIYARNPFTGTKSNSPVIREKDKRERATVNSKFRSLNTFNANRRRQVVKPSTPEPSPRKNLSLSEECLIDEKKKRSKFSIRKFLRMGTSKTTDNLYKKDNMCPDIVAGDEPSVSGKPRLVIIHPIDINPTAVEVVKEIKTTETVPLVVGKPPAPPQRSSIDRLSDLNKPARPPPPKSAELRRRQKIGFNANGTGSVKCKLDNVYANLGEIRSAIAPRKPERTASMREREAQLELANKRKESENLDNTSLCSSYDGSIHPNDVSINKNSENSNTHNKDQIQQQQQQQQSTTKSSTLEISSKDEKSSIYERQKVFESNGEINGKVELFERDSVKSTDTAGKYQQSSSDGLKNSMLKINNTIDNYLKDKRDYESFYENVKKDVIPNRDGDFKKTYDSIILHSQATRNNFQENNVMSSNGCSRSEYGGDRFISTFAKIPRVVSASYCGSEMGESDIYSPYSFYGSEAGDDVTSDVYDGIWGAQKGTKSRTKTNRLRMRKGRSVVHKSIEDNYSAVVVANHEALAQVLDQLQQSPVINFALRPLANAINLRFQDFTIIEGAQAFVVGKRAFHAAIWTTTPVTLALSADSNAISGVGGELNQLSGGVSGALNPITEFCDLVPSYHLPLMPSTEVRMLQATISVLPRMQLDTLQSIGSILKNKSQMLDKHMINFRGSIPNLSGQKEPQNLALRNVCSVQNLSKLNEECPEKTDDLTSNIPGMPSFDDVMCREVGFIMLQLVNGLKNLQSKGIEEMPVSLSNVILCKEIDNKDAQARLCVLQGMNADEDESMAPLCKCAHIALTEMLPATKLTTLLSEIFLQERSESLSKVKSILEFVLWGPSDVVLTGSIKERELALQRWLDLERATVLHGLVRTRVELTVYDECHLMFLVRSNAKIMNEAAKVLSNFENSDEIIMIV